MKVEIDSLTEEKIVVKALKQWIKYLEINGNGNDPWETPDNKALEIAAAYKVLDAFTNSTDYVNFVEKRRVKREKFLKGKK